MARSSTPVFSADARNIEAAARYLRAGELVAFPTETVYGLGADARLDAAVAAIFAAKERPRFNPLICHVADLDTARLLAHFDESGLRLAEVHWPGPLTLVLKRKTDAPVSLLVSAGLETIALRVPAHPVAQKLLNAVGTPIAAPSANRSGRLSPSLAAHVTEDFPDGVIAAVLDGGPCGIGLESTVIDLTGSTPLLLRPGGLPVSRIERLIGPIDRLQSDPGAPPSPGLTLRHYAPRTPLRINVRVPRPGEAYLGFGRMSATLNLSISGDLDQAASNLFAMLHALDGENHVAIAVAPVPDDGLGLAINDRLRRAAAAQESPS